HNSTQLTFFSPTYPFLLGSPPLFFLLASLLLSLATPFFLSPRIRKERNIRYIPFTLIWRKQSRTRSVSTGKSREPIKCKLFDVTQREVLRSVRIAPYKGFY